MNYQRLSDEHLCSDCVASKYLKQVMTAQGSILQCYYCEETGHALALENVADLVEKVISDYFKMVRNEPTDLEEKYIKNWSPDGDRITNIIADISGVDDDVAENIRAILCEKYPSLPEEHGYFHEDAYYKRAGIVDVIYSKEWDQLEADVRFKSRYFGIENRLNYIFKPLEQYTDRVILNVGPDFPMKNVFRARHAKTDQTLDEILCSPDTELGPPPANYTFNGRMNAKGISVFYGSTSQNVAVAETRAHTGSKVVVGSFIFQRNLRLLDVKLLRNLYTHGDLFDPNHHERQQHAKFLENLSYKISTPVAPDAEPFEYVSTQIIAEYFANSSMNIDGMIYTSALSDNEEKRNIVLFYKNSKVENSLINSEALVSFEEFDWYDYPEDHEFEPDYSIIEFPKEFKWQPTKNTEDNRIPTLQIDKNSLEVHTITAYTVETKTKKVHWESRLEKSDPPKF